LLDSHLTQDIRLSANTERGWIGSAPTALQLGAVLFVGVNGILIAGLQPLLLGMLTEENRLSAVELGRAATAELLTMGVAAAVAGAKLKAERLRAMGLIACVLLAIFEVMTTYVRGETLVLVRAIAGIPSGIMIWIAVALIARSLTPERWAGIYFTVQTLAQFICAAGFTAWVTPKHGANGGFVALAVLSLIAAIAAFALPDRFAPLAQQGASTGLPNAKGWLALVVAFLYLAFIVGVWVYAEPLSHQSGHEPSVAGTAVSISLACQVLGGAAATALAGKLRWLTTILLCSVLNGACLLAFASLPTATIFLATSGVFGFLWLFVLPFFVPMIIAADPTRRSAVMLGGAQLLGASLGPLLVSTLVTEQESRGALAFGAAALAAAAAIVVMLAWRQRHSLNSASLSKDINP
jgi:hypothetical protein